MVISCVVTGLLLLSGIIPLWDTALYDRFIKYRIVSGNIEKNSHITYVDLNDPSIEELGTKLDTREAFSQALEVLADANASVILDFQFRYGKTGDRAFVEALKNTRYSVIAVLAVDKETTGLVYPELTDSEMQMLEKHVWHIKVKNPGNIPVAKTFLLPFDALGQTATMLGHVNMEPDSDGVYRRVPLLYRWNDGYIPALPLAAAVAERRIPVESIELDAGKYLTLSFTDGESIKIPIDKKGNMLVPFTETWAGSKRNSLSTLVEAFSNDELYNEITNDFRNRIVFIAEISSSQKDFGPTSFEKLYPLSGIHTNVLGSILDSPQKNSFIYEPSAVFKCLAPLFLLIAGFFCIRARKDLFFHLGFLLLIAVFSGITWYRWAVVSIAPWYALPVSFIFFLWLCIFLFRLLARYREQELLKNALSRYFPRALAERIIREGKTDLVPAYKELTMLFADISGFTKWSASRSPNQVHDFLNDYLESMAEILFAHGGTVDKFMGDGILAFFGDPFSMSDHCERCIRAAIAMQKKITELAEKWKRIADINLKVRIGINTGNVIVGNLGSRTRIEYTVIGAAVNLAQRMESSSRPGGILVTAAVWESTKDLFPFGEKQVISVKGYDENIESYEVYM
ncbi:MAG: adenylate/guanylate cyclase domain-containing protein [Treponema sp.]|nr:adenylate/guanylate cyclase domain-containing protein [Treponema sp.]